MSETKQPTLSQYFGTDNNDGDDDVDDSSVKGAKDLQNLTNKVNNINIDSDNKRDAKNEPEVCRIFTETPIQPKDPTAAFFDLIGNPANNIATSGIVTDFTLPNIDVRPFINCICLVT